MAEKVEVDGSSKGEGVEQERVRKTQVPGPRDGTLCLPIFSEYSW